MHNECGTDLFAPEITVASLTALHSQTLSIANMFSGRIRCHFCGSRSPHRRSSGISNFQCTACEAVNYLDENGDILDTPASVAAKAQRGEAPSHKSTTFTKPLPETLNHQRQQTFCNTCLHNQRVYLETLSNYLPDDDHPRYKEFETALPKFKEDLAKRYPQICEACAPKAQSHINKADVYASSERIAKSLKDTRERRRSRNDSVGKKIMRFSLAVIGMLFYACVLTQVSWHAYMIFASTTSVAPEESDLAFVPTGGDCLRSALRMHPEQACCDLLMTSAGWALLGSLWLLWYNPGLKEWYSADHRIQALTGQKEHVRIHAILLICRLISWWKLSDPTVTSDLTTSQRLGAHGSMLAFTVGALLVGSRTVGFTKFSANTKIMPRPEEVNVLGAFAGPASEKDQASASSVPPTHLLARDRTAPFPISNLAPRRNAPTPSKLSPFMPSPPQSQDDDDDDTEEDVDAMDIDWQPPAQSHMPGTKLNPTYRPKRNGKPLHPVNANGGNGAQSTGWSTVRDEVFGLQDNLRTESDRQRMAQEQQHPKLRYEPPTQLNPFRGRLPQAPMSMERRIRNPPTQVTFKKAPLSKRQDFMTQMRMGIERGYNFPSGSRSEVPHNSSSALDANEDIYDQDFSPAKSRTKGNLDLRDSGWKLASDVAPATGLEDLFAGNSFSIADEPQISTALPGSGAVGGGWSSTNVWVLTFVIPLAVIGVACCVQPTRRMLCLWLVGRLEAMGV